MTVQVSVEPKEIKVRLERGKADHLFLSDLAGVEPETAQEKIESIAEDEEFSKTIKGNLISGGRGNYVQICAPFELHALTKLRKPKHVVEVGVSSGVSSAFFLHALKSNGTGVLHSIDLPERESGRVYSPRSISWALPKGKDPGWAIPSKLKGDWDLRLGSSSDVLPDLIKEIGSVDIFLYDVPYEINSAISDFKIVDAKLRKGSVALADNCQVPITWWANRRGVRVYQRKNSDLRGFSVP